MWPFILHSLVRRRWRSTAIVLGVGLGVGLLFALVVINAGISRGLANARQYMGADLLAVPRNAKLDIEQAFFSGSPLNVYMDKRIAEQAAAIPGVKRVGTQFFTQTLEMVCCGNIPEIRIVGVDDVSAEFIPRNSEDKGRPLKEDEVLVGAGIFDQVGWKGSRIELLGDIFRIANSLESTGVGVDRSILMPIATARRLATASESLRPSWISAGQPDELISALLLEVRDPALLDQIGNALEEIAPVRVIRPAESFQRIRNAVQAFSIILMVGSLLPALAGVAYLFSQVISGAWDRKGEWALYRALGASRRQLVFVVVGEAAVLALVGALGGIPLGYLLYRWSFPQLIERHAFPFVGPSLQFIGAIAIAGIIIYVLIGMIGALVPAWRVTRYEPARVMALGEID